MPRFTITEASRDAEGFVSVGGYFSPMQPYPEPDLVFKARVFGFWRRTFIVTMVDSDGRFGALEKEAFIRKHIG